MNKPILCLDFDGVLHSYTTPWAGPTVIPDPPVDGALAFIRAAREHFRVVIHTSRASYPGGGDAVRKWLLDAAIREWLSDESHTQTSLFDWADIEIVTEKPAAFVTLDDRALTFAGIWPSIASLRSFRPWNRPEPDPTAIEFDPNIGQRDKEAPHA